MLSFYWYLNHKYSQYNILEQQMPETWRQVFRLFTYAFMNTPCNGEGEEVLLLIFKL